MAAKVGNVGPYCGPEGAGAQDNLEEVIVNFIDGAQRRLDGAVQELESMPIAQTLVRARQRKVTVRIVLENDYLCKPSTKGSLAPSWST